MRVFLTGATGFIGGALIPELKQAGHHVIGLTRSDAGATALEAAGAETHRGDIEDLASLRAGAAKADGVIHCAFNHDFSTFVKNCETDREAIVALSDELAGSSRPLIVTSGTGMGSAAPGQLATEDGQASPSNPNPRVLSELTALAQLERGVNVGMMRLPQVHDPVKQGLITYAVYTAREKGVSAYIGDGQNRWPACHVSDAARCYRLALEKAEPGARYHAVAEEGVPVRDIAEALGKGLGVPVVSMTPAEAGPHFGWLAMFAGMDLPASSTLTQERLGWKPVGPTLLADLAVMNYSVSAPA